MISTWSLNFFLESQKCYFQMLTIFFCKSLQCPLQQNHDLNQFFALLSQKIIWFFSLRNLRKSEKLKIAFYFFYKTLRDDFEAIILGNQGQALKTQNFVTGSYVNFCIFFIALSSKAETTFGESKEKPSNHLSQQFVMSILRWETNILSLFE